MSNLKTQKVSRRKFIQQSAASAAAVSVGSNIVGNTAYGQKPLVFSFWPWGSEIIEANADTFRKQYSESLDLQPIPGDYPAVLETRLASKANLDMFYAQRGQASRWYTAGWINPIDSTPGLSEIHSEMLPGVVEDSKAHDGKFLGLTYYNGGPFCLFRNEKLLEMGGFGGTKNVNDYPKTWDEVAKISRELKKQKICDEPLFMGWYAAWTGLPWTFTACCYSEGERLINDDFQATFSNSTPILKVLTDWKQWWDEGLVVKSVLTMQENTMIGQFGTGKHAFLPYLDVFHFVYGDKENSVIGNDINQNPVMPGATNDTTLVGHALLSMSTMPRSREDELRIWNLMKMYGHKDANGNYHTHKRWAMKANLPVPYASIFDDQEVKDAIMKWMHPTLGELEYQWQFDGRKRAIAAKQLKAPWYMEWETRMHDMVANDLLLKGTMKPSEVVNECKKLWSDLYDKYASLL